MSAGFKIVRDDRDKGFQNLPISSITVVLDDLLELVAGATAWTLVTSSSDHFTRKAVAKAGASTAATEVSAIELDGTEIVEVQSANASDTSHNGDRMAATDENTVNNSGTDVSGQAAVFVQKSTVGATTDNRILGNVLVGNGVDPDAA